MSSKNNVNPGQYKTRGSQRQGEDVVHNIQKKEYTQASAPDQNQGETQGQPTGSVKNKKKAGQKATKTSGR
jgi:hypothetical protein